MTHNKSNKPGTGLKLAEERWKHRPAAGDAEGLREGVRRIVEDVLKHGGSVDARHLCNRRITNNGEFGDCKRIWAYAIDEKIIKPTFGDLNEEGLPESILITAL